MKQPMLLIILLFVVGTLIGGNIYLAKRFAWYFESSSTWPFYLLFAGITFFMIWGVMGLVNSTGIAGNITYRIAAILMGFVLYLLVSTLVVDGFGFFVKLSPKMYGLIALSLAALISVYGIWNAFNTKIQKVDISIAGIEKPFTAAHLTDTHIGHFRGSKHLQKLVDMINQQNVDVVFFTGDLLDGRIQLKPESMNPLANLKVPVFFVEGNHDEYTGAKAIKAYLKSINVYVLENEVKQWNGIQIVGLDHMLADDQTSSPHNAPGGPTIQKTLMSLNISKEKPTIMLHHGPDGIKYANEAGVDLYLAGHTHAGQLWPATYVAKMMFDYNKGLHNFKDTQIYVSQGTGTFGPPMRVGTNSELTILNIKP